jgi:catechol 2,3-dioxygenase-like lactoylglutathione lyase family enzyme
MQAAAPGVTHVLETSLYVADLDRAQAFYQRLFGFPPFFRDRNMVALGVPGAQVLLLFRHGAAAGGGMTAGGTIPPHDGRGRLHLCFAIPDGDLAAWQGRLAEHGIAIESRIDWPRGSVSLYFRDPDGHLLELATPRLWPNYQPADAAAMAPGADPDAR